jgi:hypothetical protein
MRVEIVVKGRETDKHAQWYYGEGCEGRERNERAAVGVEMVVKGRKTNERAQ